MTTKQTLKSCVEEFKNWRKSNYSEEQILDNLTDDSSYPNWSVIEAFFSELLQSGQISNLDEEDKMNLLYLIARGWDCGGFLYDSTEIPISSWGDLSENNFISLAKVAVKVNNPEYQEAKWLIAYCFGKLNKLTNEIEEVLLSFYQDSNEYTKRMALFSLAKLGYKDIVTLITKSWTLDDEWHKIGCLSVLNEYVEDKSILKRFLSEAAIDKRKDLSEYALQLKKENNC